MSESMGDVSLVTDSPKTMLCACLTGSMTWPSSFTSSGTAFSYGLREEHETHLRHVARIQPRDGSLSEWLVVRLPPRTGSTPLGAHRRARQKGVPSMRRKHGRSFRTGHFPRTVAELEQIRSGPLPCHVADVRGRHHGRVCVGFQNTPRKQWLESGLNKQA